jgi:hypothetical protein
VVVQPGPGSTPGTAWAPLPQPRGSHPDRYPTEQYPGAERWSDGGSRAAVTRPVSDPGVGSGAGTIRDAGLPRPRVAAGHRDDLRGAVSTDRPIDGYSIQPVGAASPTERYERGSAAERRGVVEVAQLATLLAASCPDGDRILPRLERWVDVVGLGTDSTLARPWDDVPGQPMWYVGQYMWSWSFSTPWDERGRTISANLTTFIDANGVPVAPARPGADFRGSYGPLAEALRKRIAATSSALVAAEHSISDPEISAHLEQVLGLRLDVLRLTAELDQAREAQQRLMYLYDEPVSNGDTGAHD